MKEKTTLTFTGDIGFDRYMTEKWTDPELVSGEILDVLRSSDHVIINVEGAVVDKNTITLRQVPPEEVQMLHTIDPAAVPFLNTLNADVWNLSNNHMMDAGADGLKSTLSLAADNNVSTIGAGINIDEASRPLYLDEAGGIGLISVCYRPDCIEADDENPGCFCWADMERIEKRIKEIKQTCRWCIVVAHGGEEFTSLPTPYTRDRYMKYLEMGADIVVSHHPHVPMNYEVVPALNTSDVENNDASAPDKSDSAMVTENKKLIIYSLGNFIFDTDYQRSQLNTDRGVILSLTLTTDAFDFTAYGIKLDRQTERISLDKLPEIFENVPPDEYKKLIPLSAKAFVTATKKQYIYLYPEVYTNADHDKWMECFMDPERSGRMPNEGLDFEVIYPLALEAEKGAWKDSKLEGVKKYILDQL